MAATRELEEETGVRLSTNELTQLGTYAGIGRDPRGRTLSVVFIAVLNNRSTIAAGDDASDAQWINLDEIPDLAFDHGLILKDALKRIG